MASLDLSPEKTHVLWFELDLSTVGMIGLLGNCFWFLRFFHQWIVSERRKESVIPVMFWYWSLLGTFCLGSYFIVKGNIPGTLAYLPNTFVYIRNLMLIRRRREREPAAGPQTPELSKDTGRDRGRHSSRLSGMLPALILVGLACLAIGAAAGFLIARLSTPANG
jgi:lipid-A-disaccharide synthase-like uncharacterized protein